MNHKKRYGEEDRCIYMYVTERWSGDRARAESKSLRNVLVKQETKERGSAP